MDIDVTRPRLHFTARTGWINDPLGLSFHGGRYHLFFQYVPGQTQWGPEQCWGHATSDDLLHWIEQPVALDDGDSTDARAIVDDDDIGSPDLDSSTDMEDESIEDDSSRFDEDDLSGTDTSDGAEDEDDRVD